MEEIKYRIAVADIVRSSDGWKNIGAAWPQLVKRLTTPLHTSETMDEFQALPKDPRNNIKDIGGFVGGPLTEGGARNKKSILSRSLINIDVDGARKNGVRISPDPYKVRDVLDSTGYAYTMHPTHSSRPGDARLRVVMPLSREVDAVEFQAITRRFMELIGIELCDDASARMVQAMYWPSVPKDAPFETFTGEGDPVDVEAVLATYLDYTDVAEWPGTDDTMKRAAQRKRVSIGSGSGSGTVTDPAQKPGVIGAFCSVYDIHGAIAAYGIPYRQVAFDRYSYEPGEGFGGVKVYEGLWSYSFHNTDPAGGQLCNAFDLVRLHRFGSMDYGAAPDTPVAKLPSYQAMSDLAMEDMEVKKVLISRRFGKMPDTVGDGKVRKSAEKAKTGPMADDWEKGGESVNLDGGSAPEGGNEAEGEEWLAKLDANSRGELRNSVRNYQLILTNDTALKGMFMFSDFDNGKYLTEGPGWLSDERTWPHRYRDFDRDQIRAYISRKYRLDTGKDNLETAVSVEFDNNRHHPVREWMESLQWDGTPRAETLFIDYLGAKDNELNREITRRHLRAAVRRIMHPGCKYDHVLVFVGREKIGKSTIIRSLAGQRDWFSDSALPVGDKEAYVNIAGKWLIEMGELADYNKKEGTLFKQFISATEDSYRPPYGHETVTVPRQCVFFGTTNDSDFLKGGEQGNRRFWIMECEGDDRGRQIGTKGFAAYITQVWAETVAMEMLNDEEDLFLDSRLETLMNDVRNGHEGDLTAGDMPMIEEFALMPKPKKWPFMPIEEMRKWYNSGQHFGSEFDTGEYMLQDYISVKEIALVVYGQRLDPKSRFQDANIKYKCDHIPCLEWTGKSRRFGNAIGIQKAYRINRDKATKLSYK